MPASRSVPILDSNGEGYPTGERHHSAAYKLPQASLPSPPPPCPHHAADALPARAAAPPAATVMCSRREKRVCLQWRGPSMPRTFRPGDLRSGRLSNATRGESRCSPRVSPKASAGKSALLSAAPCHPSICHLPVPRVAPEDWKTAGLITITITPRCCRPRQASPMRIVTPSSAGLPAVRKSTASRFSGTFSVGMPSRLQGAALHCVLSGASSIYGPTCHSGGDGAFWASCYCLRSPTPKEWCASCGDFTIAHVNGLIDNEIHNSTTGQ